MSEELFFLIHPNCILKPLTGTWLKIMSWAVTYELGIEEFIHFDLWTNGPILTKTAPHIHHICAYNCCILKLFHSRKIWRFELPSEYWTQKHILGYISGMKSGKKLSLGAIKVIQGYLYLLGIYREKGGMYTIFGTCLWRWPSLP